MLSRAEELYCLATAGALVAADARTHGNATDLATIAEGQAVGGARDWKGRAAVRLQMPRARPRARQAETRMSAAGLPEHQA